MIDNKIIIATIMITIIRFVNRKHVKQALYNKKKLTKVKQKYTFNPNNSPFFVSENLTRINESLAYQGRKIKCNNLGTITIKIDHVNNFS